MGQENKRMPEHPAVSHLPAPVIFLPKSVSNIALGDAMPLLCRLPVPPHPTSAATAAGRNMDGAGK
ncbi:hypothetical protein GCM10023156_30310 [Novipirellula rosea]|uniref:Uncharacterized protein n=1 Tax=Novipirellula rosea TaxID=1031540 RepID=A0ABP8MTE6_9BACT